MTQTVHKAKDPLNPGGGWASPAPFRTWSSCHRRHRAAPTYKRWHRNGPKVADQPPRKQPKQPHGRGPWFQPPQRACWAMPSNWGRWGGPWCPPPAGFWKPPDRVQVILVYGLDPLCLCRCNCWRGPWNPRWVGPPGRKKRWGHRSRGLRRQPRRSSPTSQPQDLSTLLQPDSLPEWQEAGMRAPPNTTQFIMDQIYEDMRQQELKRRRAARARQALAGASGHDAPPSSGEEDAELQDSWYSSAHNPLVISPEPQEEHQSPFLPLVKEEERSDACAAEECEGKEEGSEEKDDEKEASEASSAEEEEEEEEEMEEEEEGLQENEQREEGNELSLEMPFSFLVEAEEESENFMNCSYGSPKQIIPNGPQGALLTFQDMNF